MTKKSKPAADSAESPAAEWSPEELLAVAHLGPAVIGKEMHAAAQAYVKANGPTTGLGPATRG